MKLARLNVEKKENDYIIKYDLETDDAVDTKVFDMGVTGQIKSMIACDMNEENGVRTFTYRVSNKITLAEFSKKEVNKKQMLTLLYNLLSGLEVFGKNMVSLSYVAKDVKYIFVDTATQDVSFIVAPVDKSTTDLSEVKNLIKKIITDARYFEMDRDNYVARLISFINKSGTFSIADMKNYINEMLMDMGINIEEEKKAREKASSSKVSRVGVLMNNAKMAGPSAGMNGTPIPPQGMNGAPGMMPQGRPVNGAPIPPQGMNGAPGMMPQGRPVNGAPIPPQGMNGAPGMMPQGRPINGAPIPPQGMNGAPGMMPQGRPVNGAPIPPQGMNGAPGMMPQGRPVNGAPIPPQGMNGAPGMMPQGRPVNGAPIPPQGMNGAPGMMPQGQPMNGVPVPPQGMNGAPGMMPQGQPMNGVPVPPQGMNGAPGMMPQGRPMNGVPVPPQGMNGAPGMMPQGRPVNGAPIPPQGMNGAPDIKPPEPPKAPDITPVPNAQKVVGPEKEADMPTIPDTVDIKEKAAEQNTVPQAAAPKMPEPPKMPDIPPIPQTPQAAAPKMPEPPKMPDIPPIPQTPQAAAPKMPEPPKMPDIPPIPQTPQVTAPKMPEPPKMPDIPPIPQAPQVTAPKMPEPPKMPGIPPIPKAPQAAPVPVMTGMPSNIQDMQTVSYDEEIPEIPGMPQVSDKDASVPQTAQTAKEENPTPYFLRTRTNEKIYINKDEFTIGKSSSKVDYTVSDNSAVSRIHCFIYRRNGVSYIKDNNSTNGTFVNGEELTAGIERFLTNNMTITLGDEDFIYFVK